MDYIKPTITMGQSETALDVNSSAACVPGFAFAVAYAAAVWDAAVAINYAGIVNAAGVVAVSWLVIGTKCFGK